MWLDYRVGGVRWCPSLSQSSLPHHQPLPGFDKGRIKPRWFGSETRLFWPNRKQRPDYRHCPLIPIVTIGAAFAVVVGTQDQLHYCRHQYTNTSTSAFLHAHPTYVNAVQASRFNVGGERLWSLSNTQTHTHTTYRQAFVAVNLTRTILAHNRTIKQTCLLGPVCMHYGTLLPVSAITMVSDCETF